VVCPIWRPPASLSAGLIPDPRSAQADLLILVRRLVRAENDQVQRVETSIENWWDRYSRGFNPAPTSPVVLAGREDEPAALTRRLADEVGRTFIRAASVDDGLAVAACSMMMRGRSCVVAHGQKGFAARGAACRDVAPWAGDGTRLETWWVWGGAHSSSVWAVNFRGQASTRCAIGQ
jgi:hypothetical protein